MTEKDSSDTLPFDEAAERIGELIAHFESHTDPAVSAAVFELLNAVDSLHRAGVARLVELLLDVRGAGFLTELASDAEAMPLLELYDLLPLDDRTLVDDVLEPVRAYAHSHGGEIEVVDVQDGVVHVRLAGSCKGCSGSAVTLRRGVEEALRTGYAAFQRLEVHESVAPAAPATPGGFVTLDQLRLSTDRLRRPEWTAVAPVGEVAPGTMRGFEVGELCVLLCNVGGEIYGFRDHCPDCNLPLHDGKLSGTVLVCLLGNCAYDARTGRRVDGEEGRLTIYPVAIVDGTVKLALNVPATSPTSEPSSAWPSS